MNVLMSLYMALLFVVLTPGVLFTLPKGGSKLTVAVVHGLVFVVAFYFTSGIVLNAVSGREGFYVPSLSPADKLALYKKAMDDELAKLDKQRNGQRPVTAQEVAAVAAVYQKALSVGLLTPTQYSTAIANIGKKV